MSRFRLVSFDCYGTLIDWEEGILTALSPLLERAAKRPSRGEVLSLYATLESEAEKVWRPYREILKQVLLGLAKRLDLTLFPGEEWLLVESLPSWPPFPEVGEALKRLREKGLKWAIVSNIDQDLLAETLRHFPFEPDLIVTAEEARAYKPNPRVFDLLFKKSGLSREEILHVGQSLYHDILPAKALGLTTCWVQRPGRDPFGATPKVSGEPDLVIKDLRELLPFCF